MTEVFGHVDIDFDDLGKAFLESLGFGFFFEKFGESDIFHRLSVRVLVWQVVGVLQEYGEIVTGICLGREQKKSLFFLGTKRMGGDVHFFVF